MKFTLHSVYVLGVSRKLQSYIIYSRDTNFATNCCVKIAQKVTKMHQVFKNVSKLDDLTGILSRKNLML